MRLAAEDRGWAGGFDRPFKGGADGGSLSGFRHDTDKSGSRDERRNREGEGVLRHAVDGGEAAFADLLLAAGAVELNQFDGARVVEVGDGRVVEGDMAVLADAETAEVDGLCPQQFGVTRAFGERFGAVAAQVVEGAGGQALVDAFPEEAPETGGVIGANAQVLVHVEQRHARPINPGLGHQRVQKGNLRRCGCENRRGGGLAAKRGPQDIACGARGVGSQLVRGAANADGECIGAEGAEGHWELGIRIGHQDGGGESRRNGSHSGSLSKIQR